MINKSKTKKIKVDCCALTEKAPAGGMCLNPDDCAEKMMILSDSSRIRIIRLLLNGGQEVGKIAKKLNLSPHRVSHHLGIMRLVGLVEYARQGRNVTYSISRKIISKRGIDLGCCIINFRVV